MKRRYPAGCQIEFETARGDNRVGERAQLLRHLPADAHTALPDVPVEMPVIYATPPEWQPDAIARRAAAGLRELFDGSAEKNLWISTQEHLQHLLHFASPYGTGDNLPSGAILVAASIVLPHHPWAAAWARRGAIRLGSLARGDVNASARPWLDGVLKILAEAGDFVPALPAGVMDALQSVGDAPALPESGTFSRHMSDAGFLAALEFESDDPVRVALDGGDFPAGRTLFAIRLTERIRTLAADPWAGEALTAEKPDRVELDEICRNVLTLRAHMHIKHDFGDDVDWTTILDGDIESNVSLNHHSHIEMLAHGYRHYGEERYGHHAVRLLQSWFKQSTCPDLEAQLQWRTLESGGRMASVWPAIMVNLIDYAPFRDSALFDLARFSLMNALHVSDFFGPPNNWQQIEMAGALVTTSLLPEWVEGRFLRPFFIERLRWSNARMFFKDGMQAENSPHYHVFPWWRIYAAGLIQEALGDPQGESFWQDMETRTEPMWKLMRPDGCLPHLSDCGPSLTSADRHLRFVGRHRDRADMRALADRADAGPADYPEPCQHLPEAGYVVARTGWTPGDDFVLLDQGHFGINHQHEDKLTFLYYAGGRMLVGDAGIYRYGDGPLERYFRGADGHSVVRVDGLEQCRVLDFLAGEPEGVPDVGAAHQFVPGSHALLKGRYADGFASRNHSLWDRSSDRAADIVSRDRSLIHERWILYIWNRGLAVIDCIDGEGTHDVDRIFHLMPFQKPGDGTPQFEPGDLRISGGRGASLSCDGQTGVRILAAESDGPVEVSSWCGSKDPCRGWTALYDEVPSHDVWLRCNTVLPRVFATWIEPVSMGQITPSARTLQAERSGRDLLVQLDDEAWHIDTSNAVARSEREK